MKYSYILVFGDSNTWGAWDTEKHGWVNRLQLSVEENFDRNYETYNFGVSGDSSKEVLKRMKPFCESVLETETSKNYFSKERSIIIIEIGGNDSSVKDGKPKVTLEEFKENLSKILEIARAYTNNVAFLSVMPVYDKKSDPWIYENSLSFTTENVEKYSKVIEDFCNENNSLFINVYDSLKDRTEELLEDGVHLNNEGHRIVSEGVETALKNNGYLKLE